jgi:hypothetical protein
MEFIERVDPIRIMPIHTTAALELEKIFFTRIVKESRWDVK